MSEEGRNYPGRYVGFGFTYNPNSEPGQMVITAITPESPASKVLQVGDSFLSVNGVEVNEENMDRLNFRGKPGESVPTTVLRDGKEMDISVARGVISASYSKSQVLTNMEMGNSEEWVPDESNIIEVTSNDSVVYVLHRAKDTDDVSGLPFEAVTMNRFTFDDSGKVVKNIKMGPYSSGKQFYYRMKNGYWHMPYAHKEWCIYYETFAGPYVDKSSVITPKWAPDVNDKDEINDFLLKNKIK